MAIIAFIVAGPLFAQNANRFEFEVDPIAFALKGYSVHGIYVHEKLRFDLGVFGIEQPESFTGNKGFDTYSTGYGLKVNYLLNESETWFAGVGVGYLNNEITFRETNQVQDDKVIGVGLHTGYRFFFFNNALQNLYFAPWVSFDYNFHLNDIEFSAAEYKKSGFSIFPTIHVGYRF
ncbi:MAG TPA: hypothetical protein VEC36_09120 [Patescibacteria group bacterium]|nr:hypothetical protein [Patescibacteria group bacterium]